MLNYLRSKYCETSLNHFTLENKFRRFCIKITTTKLFENTITFLIAVNSIMLGLYDYTWERKPDFDPNKPVPGINQLGNQTEIFFTASFTIEAIPTR